jgi:nucleotide-binding universal stress UspA family protein
MHYVVACDPERGGGELLGIVASFADSDDRVTVVHVVNPLGEPWRDRDRDLPEAVAAAVSRRRASIQELVDQLGREAELAVEPTEVGEETAPAVARIARTLRAGTLVVMSKRASGLRGMLLGSVAQGLLALSPCPVLIVRPGEAALDAARREVDAR